MSALLPSHSSPRAPYRTRVPVGFGVGFVTDGRPRVAMALTAYRGTSIHFVVRKASARKEQQHASVCRATKGAMRICTASYTDAFRWGESMYNGASEVTLIQPPRITAWLPSDKQVIYVWPETGIYGSQMSSCTERSVHEDIWDPYTRRVIFRGDLNMNIHAAQVQGSNDDGR